MTEEVYKRIDCKTQSPKQKEQELNTKFYTDKGELYYWFYEKQWSCREDKLSEEYPTWWLEENKNEIDFEELRNVIESGIKVGDGMAQKERWGTYNRAGIIANDVKNYLKTK